MDSSRIKQLVVGHFRMLFSEEVTAATDFKKRTAEFPRLSQPFVQVLELPFTNNEIFLALKGM